MEQKKLNEKYLEYIPNNINEIVLYDKYNTIESAIKDSNRKYKIEKILPHIIKSKYISEQRERNDPYFFECYKIKLNNNEEIIVDLFYLLNKKFIDIHLSGNTLSYHSSFDDSRYNYMAILFFNRKAIEWRSTDK